MSPLFPPVVVMIVVVCRVSCGQLRLGVLRVVTFRWEKRLLAVAVLSCVAIVIGIVTNMIVILIAVIRAHHKAPSSATFSQFW